MSRLLVSGGAAVAVVAAIGPGAVLSQKSPAFDPQRGPVLERFASAQEFQRYLRRLRTLPKVTAR